MAAVKVFIFKFTIFILKIAVKTECSYCNSYCIKKTMTQNHYALFLVIVFYSATGKSIILLFRYAGLSRNY